MSQANELYERLKAALRGDAETPASEHLTRVQWAKRWGVCPTSALSLINAGLKKGIMAQKDYRIVVKGKIKPTPHYYEVNQK